MKKQLGKSQEFVLRSMISGMTGDPRDPQARPDRGYPNGGWCWDNHSTTVRLLDSLVRRGLVQNVRGNYTLTAAGREHITPSYYKTTEAK
jgi:hypothetical protein